MKKTLSALVAMLSFLPFLSYSQDINFSSEYNTIRWPLSLGYQGGITGDDGNSKRLTFFHGNAIFFETGSNTLNYLNTKMVINSNGNVGIGTIAPLTKLHIAGAFLAGGGEANIDPAVFNLNFMANSAKMITGWNRHAGDGETDFISNQGGGATGGFAFYNHDNSNNEFQLFRILGKGNLGIGTNNPDAKLAVNGTIHTQEVKVDMTGWSDYVFKPTYTLKPLQEVKTYIDKNQHLPEVPSEADVKKDGINLGEMNKLLLKKVEELTLYLIEKDVQDKLKEKRIEQLEQSLAALNNEIRKN